jgi:hypothetical protein
VRGCSSGRRGRVRVGRWLFGQRRAAASGGDASGGVGGGSKKIFESKPKFLFCAGRREKRERSNGPIRIFLIHWLP